MNQNEARQQVTQIVTEYNQVHQNAKKFLTKDNYYLYVGAFMYSHDLMFDCIKNDILNSLTDVQFKRSSGSKNANF